MKIAALLASALVATVVQASQVTIKYCLIDGPCANVLAEPGECTDLEYDGPLESIQNNAACKLFEYPGCGGRVKSVTRGAHDIRELKGKIVASFECSEPGLPRNLAPVVQAAEVTIKYCFNHDTCFNAFVEPGECTELKPPGPLSSIQSTANCELFTYRHCAGRSIPVKRGATELNPTFVSTIRCSEPGFWRNQRPMRGF
ncbi:hypothetical protein BGZ70_005847 [Mortierella alpina]|uniref:Uncharacterized protein n=1 Tax=Mortierella alpina TaxID=64518 RepID=A0A9P6JBW7_MORAP|nr:hypothetical protein BGZ70_005847 [Mortierella alpina]